MPPINRRSIIASVCSGFVGVTAGCTSQISALSNEEPVDVEFELCKGRPADCPIIDSEDAISAFEEDEQAYVEFDESVTVYGQWNTGADCRKFSLGSATKSNDTLRISLRDNVDVGGEERICNREITFLKYRVRAEVENINRVILTVRADRKSDYREVFTR